MMSKNLYLTNSSPKNSEFASFGLVISPTVGLCQIRAIESNDINKQLRTAVTAGIQWVVNTLESLYGKTKQEDIHLYGGTSRLDDGVV